MIWICHPQSKGKRTTKVSSSQHLRFPTSVSSYSMDLAVQEEVKCNPSTKMKQRVRKQKFDKLKQHEKVETSKCNSEAQTNTQLNDGIITVGDTKKIRDPLAKRKQRVKKQKSKTSKTIADETMYQMQSSVTNKFANW